MLYQIVFEEIVPKAFVKEYKYKGMQVEPITV